MVHWICISRQFASGGREIGQKVAQALGIPCYDRELITQSAEEHQLSADVVRDNEEFASRHLMFAYPLGSMKAFPSSYKEPMSLPDQVFYAQADTIRRLADKGPCIFLGRCAGDVLEGRHGMRRIFLYADFEDRCTRVMEQTGCTLQEAQALVKRMDKRRAAYYNCYANHKWGEADSFDLAINRSTCSIEGAVQTILAYRNALD